MPDHSTLFQQLKQKLQMRVSPFTVTIQAKDCTSNVVCVVCFLAVSM